MLKQVCEWYDFVFPENVTCEAWACLFRSEFIKWHGVHSDLFLKFEFNSYAQVLALIRVTKDHHLQSCLIVDTISSDRLFMCKLEKTNDTK